MKPLVFAISGRIGSGKSTLAWRLADSLKCAQASFGGYVRTVAHAKGLELTRENLQAVGTDLIETGWEPFCRAVLSQTTWQPGNALVVDGIRHVEAVNHLRKLVAPAQLILVHIKIDDDLRADRLRSRDSGGKPLDESHPTEHETRTTLPLVADLVLDGARPVDELVGEIIDFTRQQPA